PMFHTPPRLDGHEMPPGTYPTETGIDPLLEVLIENSEALKEWVGDAWFRITGRASVYGAGSSLTWHRDDHEFYSGAFIYYAHPEWNIRWGGELLIAEPDGLDDLPVMPFRFENSEYNERLNELGVGHYVFPKPNRLVVLGDLPHCVTPVTPAAGRSIRASLAGFFVLREQLSDSDES
ncbi:MAG: 2OG-Fe(II) oxygenase, partial [Myxococcota bacterium]